MSIKLKTKLERETFSGEVLRARASARVSDSEALRIAFRDPHRYSMPNGLELRPNMIKARDEAERQRLNQLPRFEDWLNPIIQRWCEMSGYTRQECDFWQEAGFQAAVRKGKDIEVKQVVDSDGWAWIYVRDQPFEWMHRKRVRENIRRRLVHD